MIIRLSEEFLKARAIAVGPRGGRYYVGSERKDSKGRKVRSYVGQETPKSDHEPLARYSEDVRRRGERDRRLPGAGQVLRRVYKGRQIEVTEQEDGTFHVVVDGGQAVAGRSLTGALSKALGRPVSGYSFMRLGSTWEAPVARDWRAVDAAQRALRAKLVETTLGAKVAVEHKRGGGVRAHVEHPNGERYVVDASEDGKVDGAWRVAGVSGRKWEKVEGVPGGKSGDPVEPVPAPAEGAVNGAANTHTRRGALDDYRDVGEKIGRAKKDLAAMRAKYDIDPTEAVTLDDLGEVETDPAYARALVTRDRHFGTRTQQAETFKAQGMTAGAGYLTHRLVSAIDPKPEDSPTARRQYVQAADRVQKAIASWQTTRDVAEGMQQLQDEMRGYLYTAEEREELDRFAAIEKPFTEKTRAAMKTWAMSDREQQPAEVATARQEAWRAANREESAVAGRHEVRKMQIRLAAVARNTADPESMTNVLRSLGEEFAGFVGGYTEGNKPNTSRSFRSYMDARQAAREKARAYEKVDDWGWGTPHKPPAEGAKKTPGQARKFTHTPSDEVVRIGGSDRKYVAKSMMDEFGFRGAEYGNWVDSKDATEHTQRAGEALADMAEVLGLEPKQISFNGRLGIAFGARGGGSANAHYESDRKVINLTRTRGGGSLVHEWAHALDNVLAMVSTGGASHHTSFVTENGWKAPGELPPAVSGAFQKVREAIFTGSFRPKREIAIKTKDLQGAAARAWDVGDALLAKHEGDAQAAAQEYIDKNPREDAKRYALWFALRKGAPIVVRAPAYPGTPGTTEFVATANRMGKYWGRHVELFARAFQTFMHDEMEARGRKNSYLVSGVDEETLSRTVPVLEEFGGKTSIWPRGAERARINSAMRELVTALRETGTMQKALDVLSGPRFIRLRSRHADRR